MLSPEVKYVRAVASEEGLRIVKAVREYVEKYLRGCEILQLWLGGPQRARLDTALGYYPFKWSSGHVR
ncbi:MAG: hypothetical protein QXQ28_03065 [Candidatus Nezhaarchaeales archaeon]